MTQSEVKPASNVFYGIQALRGIAACMVVLFHVTALWSIAATGGPDLAWWPGRSGVDIFFVISGFVMATTAIGKGEGLHAAGKFLERRLLRFVPLYWIATSLLLYKINILGPRDHTLPHDHVGWATALTSYLLIPHFSGANNSHPILEVGWTLSFELFFYLCFALALWLRRAVAPFLTVLLSAIVILGLFHRPSWPAIADLASPLLLEFLAGVWFGRAYQLRKTISPVATATLGGIGILAFCVGSPLPSTAKLIYALAFAAVCIVYAAIFLEHRIGPRLPRWLLLLGDSSYSLYLSHLPVLGISIYLLKRARIIVAGRTRFLDEAITCVFALLVSIAVGLATYYLLERPINHWTQRRARLRKPLQVESAT